MWHTHESINPSSVIGRKLMATAVPSPFDQESSPQRAGSSQPTPLDEFWNVVKRMPRYLRLATAMIRDDRVPKPAKVALMLGGVYTLSPIDAVPGFIPVAGQLDDLLVLLVAVREALVLSPQSVAKEHLTRYDLATPGIDADLKTTIAAAQWVAVKTIRAVGRFTVRGGTRALQLSKRAAIALED